MAKKRTGVRRVRTPSGVRYMRGGKFISKAAAKRSRKRKRTSAAKPKRKRVVRRKKVARRKPVVRRKTVRRKKKTTVRKRKANPRKRRVTARKRTTTKRRKTVAKRKSSKRSRAAKKAARTRARKKAIRSRAAKKAARTRRRKGVRRKSVRRRTSTRKRSYSRRKRVRRKSTRRRRNPRRRLRRTAKGRFKPYKYKRVRRKLYRRKNPMKGAVKGVVGALKKGAMFWAGLTGARMLNGVIKGQLQKTTFAAGQTGAMAKLMGVVPSLVTVLGAGMILPKVVKKKAILDAVQLGASIALFEAVFDNFIQPVLPASISQYLPAPAMQGYGGYVSVPVSGGVGEYVDYDNRLGEYVDYDNRYSGFEVSEALADSDMAYIQSGGAGGIFAKTSLGWG